MSDTGVQGPVGSAAAFASGLPHRSPAPRPSLRRRILFLLVPGILLIALGIGGVAMIYELDSGSEGESAQTPGPSACDRASSGPEVDLGIRPAGGTGRDGGARVDYPTLNREQVRRLVMRAKRAGASIISTPALWADLQERPSAFYDWRLLDLVIDEARKQGLKVRLRAGTMPAFALDRRSRRQAAGDPSRWRPPQSDSELARWSTFLSTLARHAAGRVDYIEVWREPNSRDRWTTGPDPAAFARMLEASYQAVKRVDPTITVVSGGLERNDIGFLQGVYEARDDLFGEGTRLFDQVGVHPYSGDRPPSTDSAGRVGDGPFGRIDRNFLGFQDLHEVMTSNGDQTVPLYVGEFGYPTRDRGGVGAVPDSQRADYLQEAFEAAGCVDYVSALGWYAYHPGPGVDPAWTLLDRAGVATLTYQALRRRAVETGLAG